MNDIKQWCCPNGHVIGMVQEDAQGNPRLAIYRHAVDMVADEPAEVEMVALVFGSVIGVCDICSETWKWRASMQAIIGLALQLDPRQIAEFGERVARMNGGCDG